MMTRILSELEITAKKDEILTALRINREKHVNILQEARAGFKEKARVALEARLAEINNDKIVALSFSLKVPVDFTSVYDTAIASLEFHTGTEVQLNGQQVDHLLMDKWDWKEYWLEENQRFSVGATQAYNNKEF